MLGMIFIAATVTKSSLGGMDMTHDFEGHANPTDLPSDKEDAMGAMFVEVRTTEGKV